MNTFRGNVFYGAAIQGEKTLGGRAVVHETLISTIRKRGFHVLLDHTSGRDRESISGKMEEALGTIPAFGTQERRRVVRDRLIEMIEGDIVAAVFEVSTPSLGTGVEITHAYLRRRLGFPAVPILLLYEEGFWPHDLSTMIAGIEDPCVRLVRYRGIEDAVSNLERFLEARPLIRPAVSADAEAIHRAHMTSIRERCAADYTREQIAAWAGREFDEVERVRAIREEMVWVVEIAGEVEGVGHLRKRERNGEVVGEIHLLYLTPRTKGWGLGKSMLRQLESIARGWGVRSVILSSTKTSVGFYEKQGYARTGECFDYPLNCVGIPCLPMEKRS